MGQSTRASRARGQHRAKRMHQASNAISVFMSRLRGLHGKAASAARCRLQSLGEVGNRCAMNRGEQTTKTGIGRRKNDLAY
jgi:hypothetical protein